MKKELLNLKKSLLLVALPTVMVNTTLLSDEIDHLDRLLMVGEIEEDDYNFQKEKLMDGIDPIIRLQMVGEDPNYDYSKNYIKSK